MRTDDPVIGRARTAAWLGHHYGPDAAEAFGTAFDQGWSAATLGGERWGTEYHLLVGLVWRSVGDGNLTPQRGTMTLVAWRDGAIAARRDRGWAR